MRNNKLDMLDSYVKAGISPILLEEIPTTAFKNAVVIEANCTNDLLNGHYEDINFVPPEWYNKLLEKSKNTYALLVINELNKIASEDQLKFIELFKYKKISTFELPKNCIIVVTASNLYKNPINEEVYSLLVHI